MSAVHRRLVILLGALLVGGLFVAGLFVSGRPGGALLLVTDLILAGLTWAVWSEVRPQGRPLRLAIIAAAGVLAVVKLVHG